MLVASSGLLLALVLYVLFGGWLPARQRTVRLETELREVYGREAALQARLAQQEHAAALRDQQLAVLRAEREALARRVSELERELAALRARRR
jgi:septal ring factor EnvC (AmiA/AmiB activator)